MCQYFCAASSPENCDHDPICSIHQLAAASSRTGWMQKQKISIRQLQAINNLCHDDYDHHNDDDHYDDDHHHNDDDYHEDEAMRSLWKQLVLVTRW